MTVYVSSLCLKRISAPLIFEMDQHFSIYFVSPVISFYAIKEE